LGERKIATKVERKKERDIRGQSSEVGKVGRGGFNLSLCPVKHLPYWRGHEGGFGWGWQENNG